MHINNIEFSVNLPLNTIAPCSNRLLAVHLLQINDVDSVCGVNVHVVAPKNLMAVPMKMAPMTKIPKTMETTRFVILTQIPTTTKENKIEIHSFCTFMLQRKRRFRPRNNRFGRNRGQRQEGQEGGEESGEDETTGDDGGQKNGNSNGRRQRFFRRNFRQRKPGNGDNAEGNGEQKDGENGSNGNARRPRNRRFRPRNRPNKNRSSDQVCFQNKIGIG